MNRIFFVLVLFSPYFAFADQTAITSNGEKVILKVDGTWDYASHKKTKIKYSENAKSYFSEFIRDPDSTKFRKLKSYIHVENGKERHSVCGELNAKNLFGAYIGYTPFYYKVELNFGAFLHDNTNSDIFYSSYDKICHQESDSILMMTPPKSN